MLSAFRVTPPAPLRAEEPKWALTISKMEPKTFKYQTQEGPSGGQEDGKHEKKREKCEKKLFAKFEKKHENY